MIHQRHRIDTGIYAIADLLATVAAFFAAWYLRFGIQIVPAPEIPHLGRYLQLMPVIVILWPIVFYFHGLYQLRRGRSRIPHLGDRENAGRRRHARVIGLHGVHPRGAKMR